MCPGSMPQARVPWKGITDGSWAQPGLLSATWVRGFRGSRGRCKVRAKGDTQQTSVATCKQGTRKGLALGHQKPKLQEITEEPGFP